MLEDRGRLIRETRISVNGGVKVHRPTMPPDSLDGALFRCAVEGDGSVVDCRVPHPCPTRASQLGSFPHCARRSW